MALALSPHCLGRAWHIPICARLDWPVELDWLVLLDRPGEMEFAQTLAKRYRNRCDTVSIEPFGWPPQKSQSVLSSKTARTQGSLHRRWPTGIDPVTAEEDSFTS